MPLACANAVAGQHHGTHPRQHHSARQSAHSPSWLSSANRKPGYEIELRERRVRVDTGRTDKRRRKYADADRSVKHLRRYTAWIPRSCGDRIQNAEMARSSLGVAPAGESAAAGPRSRPPGVADRPGHLHQRHRADPLPAVRAVPPAGRPCAVQSHHLRRGAPSRRADRGRSRRAGTCRRGSRNRDSATSPANAVCPTPRSRRSRAGSPAAVSRATAADLPAAPRWSVRLAARRARSRRRRFPSTRCAPTAPTSSATSSSPCPGPARASFAAWNSARAVARVHHANIRVDPTPASRRLDEADPEPGYEGHDPALRRLSRRPFPRLDAGTGAAARAERPRVATRRGRRSRRAAPSAADRQAGARSGRRSACTSRASRPRARRPSCGSGGRTSTSLPARRDYRVTDAYVLPVDAEIRAIQPHAHYRARSVTRMRGAAGRRAPAAHRHPPLGLQLAGSVPVCDALLGAGGHDARDGVRVRQLGRERAESRAIRRSASRGAGDRRTRWPTSGFS